MKHHYNITYSSSSSSPDTCHSLLIILVSIIAFVVIGLVVMDRVTTTPEEEGKRTISKVSFEGHDYLIYQHNSITHSPECRCYKNGK
jgi:hypothetical protein